MGVSVANHGTTPGGDPDATAKRRLLAGRGALLCLLAAVLGCLTYWLTHAALTDDGYITLDYARTLANHGTWGMTAGIEANTATSPANVLLLAALMVVAKLITGQPHPIVALGLLTVASMVATAAWWTAISRRLRISPAAAATGLGLVVLSPLALSAIGLESTLAVALLVGLVAEAVRGRPVVFGVVAGVAVLTRLDLIVFVVLIALGTAAIRRGWWRALLAMLVVALPWFVTSWFVLGSAIPDTLAIKQQQAYAGNWTFLTGPGLFVGSNTAVPAIVSFVPALLGLAALLAWLVLRRRGRLAPVALLGVGGVLYWVVYALLGVPPYVWYYVPTVATLTLFFAAALDPLATRARRASARPVVAMVGTVAVVGTLFVDVGHGLPWRAPPIFGNFANPADYMRVGAQLRPILGNDAVEAPGELGTLVFACDCKVLDQFSDRGSAIPFLRRQVEQAGPLTKWLWKLNFANLDWSQQPLPRTYRLEWHHDWYPPPELHLHTWHVNSQGIGPGRFELLPADAPPSPPY